MCSLFSFLLTVFSFLWDSFGTISSFRKRQFRQASRNTKHKVSVFYFFIHFFLMFFLLLTFTFLYYYSITAFNITALRHYGRITALRLDYGITASVVTV